MNGAQRLVEQDRREGVDLGQRRLVAALLESKFGPLSEEHRRQLDAASFERLEATALRVVSADGIDVVFAE